MLSSHDSPPPPLLLHTCFSPTCFSTTCFSSTCFSSTCFSYTCFSSTCFVSRFAIGTLNTPVTNLAFSLPRVMGAEVEPFSLANLFGLAAICSGIWIYKTPAPVPVAEKLE